MLAVVVAGGAVWLWTPPDRITPSKLAHLQTGMSRAEVETVLGPPGNYASGPLVFLNDAVIDFSGTPGIYSEDPPWWITDTVVVVAEFDGQGQATSIRPHPCRSSRPYLDDLRWRLKQEWRRWFP
jgi:hypothetical protein